MAIHSRSTERFCAARSSALMVCVLCSVFLCLASALAADAPIVDIQPHVGTVSDSFQLTVTVKNASGGISAPEFPDSNNFAIESMGTSSRNEFINGVQSSEVEFTFSVRAAPGTGPGNYSLPQGTLTVGGKEVTFSVPKITLVADTGRVPPQAPAGSRTDEGDSPIDFTQLVDNFEPYLGEQVIYRAEVAISQAVANPNLGNLSLNGFFRESFGKNQEQVREIGNTTVHSVLEGIFPAKSGELAVPERTLSASVRVADRFRRRRATDLFDDFFGGIDGFGADKLVPRKFTAKGFTIHVKDLPPPPDPNLGYVPVGVLVVTPTVDQTSVKEGESVTMKIDIVGDANLKPYELPHPVGGESKDFKVYLDKPEVEVNPSKTRILFRKRFSLAFVPQHAGLLTLPQYRLTWFNPKEQRYVSYDTGVRTVNVRADAQADKLVVKGGQPADSAATDHDQKTEVKVLGEGILPLHLGSQTYNSQNAPSRSFLLLVLFGLPGIALPIHLLALDKRRRVADPAALLQTQAYRKCLDQLEKLEAEAPENAEERCLAAIRTYLGHRFRMSGESLTSADVKDVLADLLKHTQTGEQAETLFSKLQLAIYGGGSAAQNRKHVVHEARAFVQEVEKDAK